MDKHAGKAEWMTEQQFFLFILPLMVSAVFQQVYSPINAALVSHYRSAESVAVIGACGFIGTLQNLFFGGMSVGFGIYLCECAGSENKRDLQEGTTAALWSCAALAVLGIVLSLFSHPILDLLHVKDELIGEAVPYASVVFAGSGTYVLKNTLIWLLQARKETGRSGLITAISVVTQTAITILLIGVMRLPVWASAAAVICNNLLISILIALVIRRRMRGRSLLVDPRTIPWNVWRSLLRSGISKSLLKIFSAFSGFFTGRLINSCLTEQISGYTFAMTFSNIPQVMIGAYGTTAAILWGQWKGAGRMDLLKMEVRRELRHALVMAAAMYLFVVLTGRHAVALLSGSENAVLLDTGYRTLLYSSVGFLGLALYTVGHNGLQAIGKYRIQPILGAADMLMSMISVVFFGKALGIYTMSLSIILSWTVCGSIALFAVRKALTRGFPSEEAGHGA